MNQTNRFERELTAWLGETAVSRMPDYTDDILRQTSRVRQRPRWTFLERWLPVRAITLGRLTVKPLPWRTIGLLAALGLLLAALLAIYAGSRPRLAAPFGPAANGLVTYDKDGDIFTVDPVTGARQAIVIGPEQDQEPRWALDGTRLAFLRTANSRDWLVIANADGSNLIVAKAAFIQADSDSVAWSPNGRSIALTALDAGSRRIFIVDTTDGDVTKLAVNYRDLEVHWRPPDGRQLMFIGENGSGLAPFLVSLDDGSVEEVAISDGDSASLRLVGWTPDGQRFAFHRSVGDEKYMTYVVDLATGAEVVVPVAFGHLSNDGSRIVGLNGDGQRAWPCVARIGTGSCVRIGPDSLAPDGSYGAGLQWSPDDEWILAAPAVGPPVLLDPDGQTEGQPPWVAEGAKSWQRTAP